MFYCSRANLKNNVKLMLDLTKNRYKIFTRATETVKSYDNVNYIMVDIKCRLKVNFKDRTGKFFTDIICLKKSWKRKISIKFRILVFMYYSCIED